MSDAILVVTNTSDLLKAQGLARLVVESGLAACVNILPAVQSVYRWENNVEEAAEVTLLIKTVRARYAQLEGLLKAAHSYQLPEIIALPIVLGLPAYLQWLTQETGREMHD